MSQNRTYELGWPASHDRQSPVTKEIDGDTIAFLTSAAIIRYCHINVTDVPTDMLEVDLSIDVHLIGRQTIVSIKGQTLLLPQIIAQFAWLGAACRVSPDPEHNCFTTARIKASPSPATTANFSVEYSFDFKPPPQDFGCWFAFGCYASVASGFPISARREGEEGLELGLELMATMSGTDYATSFKGNFFLKGFASMLVPVKQTGNSILWHFTYNSDGEFLPYTASDAVARTSSFDSRALNESRHFVGWTSAAEVCFGKSFRL